MEIVERSFIPIVTDLGLVYLRVGEVKYFLSLGNQSTQVILNTGEMFTAAMNSEDFLKQIVSMYRAALFPPQNKSGKKDGFEKPVDNKGKTPL